MRIIVGAVRYLLLKFMKKIGQPDNEHPSIAAADQLLDKLLPSAFGIFKDKSFREVVDFEKRDQEDQDRIFNELQVAAISVCLFCLEHRESLIQKRDFHFWEKVHGKIPEVFENKLLGFGADSENAKLFKDLIGMRHEEYGQLNDGNLDWIEKDERMENVDSAHREVMARVQAVTIGTADHIRRGKLKKDDKLLRLLWSWLFPLDLEISKFIKKL